MILYISKLCTSLQLIEQVDSFKYLDYNLSHYGSKLTNYNREMCVIIKNFKPNLVQKCTRIKTYKTIKLNLKI